MKKFFSIVISGIFIFTIICLGLDFYLKNSIKLPAPSKPPAFSVTYLYYFSWSDLSGKADVERKIADDMKNIKSGGFDGVKFNFYFDEDNSLPNTIAQTAAKNELYPIGQLVGHDAKPKDRAFTSEELINWENFVRDEVRKNKDLIYFWEVWNEPNMVEIRFRYGTAAEYLELLKRTQKIIIEENPLAKVIVTADHTDTQAEAFTNDFLARGGADYFDYLSFHPYNTLDPNSRYTLAETINQEKELSLKYNKPLWITEIGYPDSDSSEERQATVAQTIFQTAFENKIPINWFHWSDLRVPKVDGKAGWGLIREDNTFKPAFQTIQTFISNTKASNAAK